MANFKLKTFDTTNHRPKLVDSNLTILTFKDVEVLDLPAPTNYSAATDLVTAHLAGIDAALLTAGGTSFSDSLFAVYDNGDATKIARLEVSAITTGTTRTITVPDSNVNLGLIASAIQKDGSTTFTANQPVGGFKLTGLAAGSGAGDSVRYEQAILVSGANAFSADQSIGSFKLTNLAAPISGTDAANKTYVDDALDGRKWKQSVLNATTADITLSGEQTIDGVLTSASRILVKDQTLGENNGIYVTAAGAWARSSDANTAAEVLAAAVFVEQGTLNGNNQYAQTADSITLGTTPLLWVLSSANGFSGGDMIALSGGTFSVDLTSNAGLVSTNPGNAAGQLQVNSDESTIERVGNSLRVKDLGITAAKLAADSVTTVKILDSNVTTLKLAATSVTKAKINADVAGFGLIQLSDGALADDDVRSLQNDDAASFVSGEFGIIEADGNVVKLSAQYAGTINIASNFVVALETIVTTATGRFAVGGLVLAGFTGLAEELPVYAHRTTAGLYTQSLSGFVAGEHVIKLGKAVSATQVKFEPEYVVEF